MTALEADQGISNLEEEEVAVIEEIGEVLEKRQKDKVPALRDILQKKLLEETVTVDKVLCKFETHSITKANELFYMGAVIATRLEVKINKAAK